MISLTSESAAKVGSIFKKQIMIILDKLQTIQTILNMDFEHHFLGMWLEAGEYSQNARKAPTE